MPLVEFTATLSIAAAPAQTWQAIVDPLLASQYHWAPLRILEPARGGRISYGTEETE